MPNVPIYRRITVVQPSNEQVGPAVEAALRDQEQESPLWPLQSELRSVVETAIKNGVVSPEDTAEVWDVNNAVDTLFAKWRSWPLTYLRNTIKAKISPPRLDLSGKPLLAGLQQALLNASHWNDQLPS